MKLATPICHMHFWCKKTFHYTSQNWAFLSCHILTHQFVDSKITHESCQSCHILCILHPASWCERAQNHPLNRNSPASDPDWCSFGPGFCWVLVRTKDQNWSKERTHSWEERCLVVITEDTSSIRGTSNLSLLLVPGVIIWQQPMRFFWGEIGKSLEMDRQWSPQNGTHLMTPDYSPTSFLGKKATTLLLLQPLSNFGQVNNIRSPYGMPL